MSRGDGKEKEVGEELRGWMEGRGKYGGGGVVVVVVQALFTRHLSKLVLISVTQPA